MGLKYFNPNTSVVPVYNRPEFSSGKITEIILGESCEILDQNGNWIKIIQDDGYQGWANSFYGTVSESFKPTTHMYIGQTVQFEKDGKNLFVPFGARILENDSMYNNPFIKDSLVPLEQKPFFDNIIPLAKTLLGLPYRWGGKTSFGFDCSGFIQTVCRACGIHLPRDAWQQAKALESAPIDPKEAKLGDIHFFGEDDKVTHVGFSLGGETILHAQGWVKEESFNKNNDNFNASLKEKFLSSYSIRRNFQP